MPTVKANLDVTQYVRVNIGTNSLILQAHRDAVRIVLSKDQPVFSNEVFHVIGSGFNEPYKIPFTDSNIWALATSETSSLTVTEIIDPSLLPKTAFGELSVAALSSSISLQFPYNINQSQLIVFPGNGGAVGNGNTHANVSTGTSPDGFAILISRDVLKYNPGQGGLVRFTALFTVGVADSEQIIGLGNTLNGLFFGFDGEDFGILRRANGNPEVRALTITTPSTTDENITITLDGDSDATVAVTNSGDPCVTAREIAEHDFASLGVGWGAISAGDKVEFVSLDAASHAGTFDMIATTAVGSYDQLISGNDATDTWVKQADWNRDTMEGPGLSSLVLDPTKGNVFQISYQWLGYGSIRFFVEIPDTGEFRLVHHISYANINVIPSLGNPTLPLLMSARNFGNTIDLTVQSASMSAFVEGIEHELGPSFSAGNLVPVITAGEEKPILTIRNKQVFQNSINQVRISPEFVTFVSNLGNTNANTIFRTYINADPEDGCVYSDINSNSSVVEKDVDSLGFNVGVGAILQHTFILSAVESRLFDISALKGKIAPRSTFMITAEPSKSNAANEAGATINWKELF